MARRKGSRNKAGGVVKGKSTRKERVANHVDRNRASPFPLTQLYNGLTDGQRAAVVAMGQGSFLDIKCNSLHNPLISWFARCYDADRRAFVVPCRGIIPLSEEAVELLTGLPRGPLEVKYYQDSELEEKISLRLFPGLGIRPKVSSVAERIANYKEADDTFKELWMVHTVSTVLAPTRDNHISNSCYPMLTDIGQAAEMNLCKFVVDQLHENFSTGKFGRGCLLFCMLRYITALNTDDLVLELENAPFAINSWTNKARDAVAALDRQEHDSATFGAMQLRDEFRDVLSREMGLFGGPDGFESWMKLNVHPTCSFEQSKRAHSLMLSFASTVNTALINLVQGFTEAIPCDRCAEVDATKGGGNVSDVDAEAECREEGNHGSDADAEANSSSSEEDEETETEAVNVSKVQDEQSHRVENATDIHAASVIAANKRRASKSASTHSNEAGASCTASPTVIHSQIAVPSDSELFGSDGAGFIGGFVNDSPNVGSQQVDDEIRGSAANLAASLTRSKLQGTKEFGSALPSSNNDIKLVVAKELGIPLGVLGNSLVGGVINQQQGSGNVSAPKRKRSSSLSPTRKSPRFQTNSQQGSGNMSASQIQEVADIPVYNPLHKRKCASTLSPTRKSPRFQQDQSGSSTLSPTRKSPRFQQGDIVSKIGSPQPATKKGGNKDEAMVVSSKKKDGKGSRNTESVSEADGSSAKRAFVVSPTVRSSPKQSMSDGRSAKSAYVVSPSVDEPKKSDGAPNLNLCTDLVVSAQPQQRDSKKSDGSDMCSQTAITPELRDLVKGVSDSFNKHEVQQARTSGKKPMSDGGSGLKRKHTEKIRDNRPGMFTPPTFHLLSSSQETSSPEEPFDARPFSWAPTNDASEHETTDDGFEEFKMSKELQDFISGNSTELSVEGEKEFDRYEEFNRVFLKRKMVIKEKAKPGPTVGVRSITPNVNPHKARVKRMSRFRSSPYDASLTVTAEQEEVYNKIMLSSSRNRDGSSKLKSFRIIEYQNSWVFTSDLADSIHVRGELSNSCMEVGIEYLQRTNTIKEKKIMPYLISKYLMDGEFSRPLVIHSFKRTPTYSLSVMKRVHFPVMHEIARGEPFGNHWYCLCLNLEAERFEALDSLHGEGNVGLIGHVNGFITRIKTLWSTYYHDSKIQIENYELKIIDAPRQFGTKDCGFHVLHNIENWDGQNIPQISKDDVGKMRKLFPYKWATASFNKSKNWRWHLDNNKLGL